MKQKVEIVVKKVKKSTSLVLRCCRSDMSSKNGFVWPGVGEIATAPDWQDNNECGNGLHGWLYGQGDHSTSDFATDPDAKWLVVQVEDATIRMLGGKCKFPSGKVVFVGGKSDAADYIVEHEPKAKNVAVIGRLQSVADGGISVGGDLATLTGGDYATLTGGDGATLTGGYRATLTGGNGAELRFRYYDSKAERCRIKIGYVGEDGIKPNVAYRIDDKHQIVEAT